MTNNSTPFTHLAALAFWGAAMANLPAAETGIPFDAAWLRAEAKRVSTLPYEAPPSKLPDWIDGLDYDAYQSIKFRKEKSLWHGGEHKLEARLFHLGLFFRKPVTIHEVENGMALPVHYSKDLFTYGDKLKVPVESFDRTTL